MAQKNGGYAFFYVSSVSFDAFIAWIVASTIFNSLSSKAFNMASIRFLHSLPLFWDSTVIKICQTLQVSCDYLLLGVEPTGSIYSPVIPADLTKEQERIVREGILLLLRAMDL